MPVVLDGSQPRQGHAFSSPLAYVISVELTDSNGLSGISARRLDVMVNSWRGWRNFAWLDGTQVSVVTEVLMLR